MEKAFDDWLTAVRGRLRSARLKAELSHRAAGQQTGVPFTTITRVETGKTKPTAEVLFRLAVGYGLKLGELLADPPRRRA